MKTVPATPWLYPEEHPDIVEALYHYGLLKFDNNYSLPLKKGGTTDVYINLRDARNNPRAVKFIVNLFRRPIDILNPKKFVEIPDSVSCFAGPLAIKTKKSFLTIREAEKKGRATNSRIIGSSKPGQKVCMIDDVITDGASKVIPYGECRKLGLDIQALLVLVDRQQGWKEYLNKAGIDLPVWPGMTLHQVRRQLIELGLMQRCREEREEKNPIIVALDGKSWDELLPKLELFRNSGAILKVNSLLFKKGIENLLPDLSVYGRVMADLKSHDIPQTVEYICRDIKPHNPWAITIHSSGGRAMVKAAKDALSGTSTKLLTVTVLTSMDEKSSEEVFGCRPKEEVLKLAKLAMQGGADGFVCSPKEVKMLSDLYPGKEFATPGIRPEGTAANDQKRFDTPARARKNGATHQVIGRPILNAANPVAEMYRILHEDLAIDFEI